LLTVGACAREERDFSEPAAASARSPGVPMGDLRVRNAQGTEATAPAEGSAWAVARGKQLYAALNCAGCHAEGGGAIGPPLMDAEWIYGSAAWEVYASIAGGRPNGMPEFGSRLPEAQVWQLVAYVRSMSGQLRKDVRPSRDDHMQVKPSEASTSPERPRPATLPAAGMPR
jgi:cytochrome c oxidase cbb3-type subunit III